MLGARTERVVAVGGIALKSEYIMQVMADVLKRPIQVPEASQACALGAAMAASVACGAQGDLLSAQKAMAGGILREYLPDARRGEIFDKRYARYLELGAFGEHF